MSLSLAGLGRPLIQKGRLESWIIGREPRVIDTASTPGTERIASSKRRRRARVSAEVVLGVEGMASVKVMAWPGVYPGFTRQSAARVRIIRAAPTRRTRARATSAATKAP